MRTSDAGGDPSEDAQVLRARARALAQPLEQTGPVVASIEVVEFRVGHERYAIETRYVREVYPLKDLTPLPCSPPFVAGVVNIRGRIVPVIDLLSFFDLPAPGLSDLHRIILIEGQDMELGLLAAASVSVGAVPSASLQPSLGTLTGLRDEYVKGITGERLVVLDVERILADPKVVVQEEVDTL